MAAARKGRCAVLRILLSRADIDVNIKAVSEYEHVRRSCV